MAPSSIATHRGTRAVMRMVEVAPSTGGLALWVRHRDLDDGGAQPPIATDGGTVFYGSAFDRLPLVDQVGLVARQVLHVALRHPQRRDELARLRGDVDPQLFAVCAEAIVTSALAHLDWLRLPASAVHLDRLLAHALGVRQGVEVALLEWDVERLYAAIDDRRSTDRRQERDGRAGSVGRADGPRAAAARALGQGAATALLPTGNASTPPEREADEARAWSERIVRAHANDGAFSMLRALLADLPTTRTPWEQALRTQLTRGLSSRPALSWSRPSRSYIANQGRSGPHRRLPWEPGHSGRRAVPRLAVVVDVSGSIDAALLERFATEIDAITRRLEAGLVLVIGDALVRRVVRCEPGRSGLRGIAFDGGGGTDFTPLLEEADRHRPDLGVVLTDLDGPTRFEPRWPVLWAVPTTHRAAVPPFGRKLELR